VQAGSYIVPVSRSAADQIRTLREQASGKFISASDPGVYEYEDVAGGRGALAARPAGRKIGLQ